ncbi:MAG: hypothetical protein QUS11_09125 [Candidatus Fermentibacter sp.]|nr:hypothetical protein [Candidatus Fermentibacter sp.]
MRVTGFLALGLLLAARTAAADDEASNRPVVRSSEHGICYARSIPEEDWGTSGETLVYFVDIGEDELISRYGWFSSEIYLGGSGDRTVVRFGPWQRGTAPDASHFALGIYRDGETIREYSTLELAEAGSGVSRSVSHYEVFGERFGFRWLDSGTYVFEVEGADGGVMSFDLATGDILD